MLQNFPSPQAIYTTMTPRYFKPLPGKKILFWNWPLFTNGQWDRIPPPDEEPEQTWKEYAQQEQDSHLHN
jgi:hypothetical protein